MHILLLPPFAKSAKDGTPEPLVAGREKRRTFDGPSAPLCRPTYAGANMEHPSRVDVRGMVDYQGHVFRVDVSGRVSCWAKVSDKIT